jgi:hypothetical protein
MRFRPAMYAAPPIARVGDAIGKILRDPKRSAAPRWSGTGPPQKIGHPAPLCMASQTFGTPPVRTTVAQPELRGEGVRRNVLDDLGAHDAPMMKHLFGVIAVADGAHREAALDAIIEDALTLPDCITKLFVLPPPKPDRDGRDIQRFSEVVIRRAATAESTRYRRELAPVLRWAAAWMLASQRARHGGDPA